MANLVHCREVFLFCLSIISSFWYMSDEGAVNFDYPPQTDIHLSGKASINMDAIELTTCKVLNNGTVSIGRETSTDIIPLWDRDTSSQALASFSTYFQFSVPGCSNLNRSGDGLALFLAPPDYQFSDTYGGAGFGLFSFQTVGNSSSPTVAVDRNIVVLI